MVSYQQQKQKVDEVDRVGRSFSAPMTWLPSLGMGDQKDRNTQDDASGKSPNKRTYEQASLLDQPVSDIDKNNNINNGSNSSNNTEALLPSNVDKLEVIPAISFHLDADEDYVMSSKQRGYCVIINNVDFGNLFPNRKGSDKDAFRLKKIWTKLGFEVVSKRNQSSEKIGHQLKLTAALCKREHNALVVIILSHGSEHGVYGVDGIEVDLNEVLTTFDNERCKKMQGKPKVFFIQACRGRMLDEGVSVGTQLLSQVGSQATQPSQWTQLSSQAMRMPRWGTIDNNHCPLRTDMLLCFSTQCGYVSHRNEDEGSWMGTSLAIHLCKQAHRRHMMDILNMVSRDLRKRRSSSDLKQALEVNCLGFDKNLYLNPGLFK